MLWRKLRLRNKQACALLILDVRSLDDRPPFLDFSLMVSGKTLRCLLLTRGYFLPLLGKPLLHQLIGKRMHHGALSFPIISLDVPLGAHMPCHREMVTSGKPIS